MNALARSLAAVLLYLAVLPAAHAQVTIDVAKITCDQFIGYRIWSPTTIAIWLSGYYNGKHGNTTIDTKTLEDNTSKLKQFCLVNREMPVMQAVEDLLSSPQ
jgi:acid stress chaperone HdeB